MSDRGDDIDKTTQDFFDKMKELTGKTYDEIDSELIGWLRDAYEQSN